MRLKDRSNSIGWNEFQERYGELLYRYARSVGASHADAEDSVQDVVLYLFKAMDGFEYDARKGRFRGYLRSSVIRALARRNKRDAKQAAPIDPRNFDFVAAKTEAGADVEWEREWRMHRLRWALRSIAGEFEQNTMKAFELHVLGGLSADETATEIGISKASVYQAKTRVLKRVRAQLKSVDPDEDV
jgi:RNA polymerase sigma-70 factor (ECF subfamily)